MEKFCFTAEALRDLRHDLVVDVQHDRIAGGLKPEQRCGKQIAGHPLDGILYPGAGPGTVTVPAIDKLAAAVVLEDHNGLSVFVVL